MTDTPRGPVALELSRARSSLEAATVLLAAGLHADAVSHAYYAMFHAATVAQRLHPAARSSQ